MDVLVGQVPEGLCCVSASEIASIPSLLGILV